MTPEEFERLKAREREHLEKMRELKRAVGQLERQRSVADALTRLQNAAQDLIDRNTDLVDDIARETAFLEARSDIALEEERQKPASDSGIADEELQRLRAQKLIEEIKQESATTSEKDAPAEPRADRTVDNDEQRDRDTPEKTIGRMR